MDNNLNKKLPYMVGGLLYIPALNDHGAEKIVNEEFDGLTSAAFCLEDSIMDNAVEAAEEKLLESLGTIRKAAANGFTPPLIFVRVRTPQHLEHLAEFLGETADVLTGYIFPKFDMSNGREYMDILKKINSRSSKKFYAMPILESPAIAEKRTRIDTLYQIYDLLSANKEQILNVRVGGNDFCNIYGLRRSVERTIYDIGTVRDILVDILNVFSRDFVVSGAVWEYFGDNTDEPWAEGMRKELELDRLNGFIGKTVVHPSQLRLVRESLMVSKSDYEDALSIVNWKSDTLGVSCGKSDRRMNEVKCHMRWAERICLLGQIYGIKEKNDEKFVQATRCKNSA